MIDVKLLAQPVAQANADLAAFVEHVLSVPPHGVPWATFCRERQRFIQTWHDALPDLPDDEIDGTIMAIGQLATARRGGRS